MAIGSEPGPVPESFVVREVQTTPNPNAVKLVLDRPIAADVPVTARSADAAGVNPVARRLLGIAGVTAVLMLNDFVTLTKSPDATWGTITRKAKQILKAP